MKILIDLTAIYDRFSGIERYAASLALEMIKHREHHFVLIFKNQVHPMFQEKISQSNVTGVVIRGKNKLIFNQILLPLKLWGIQADRYLFLAFPVPVLFFKRNIISTIHDISCWDCPDTMKRLSKWYFRISHRIAMLKCKAIVTISDFSEKRIVEKLHYPKEKIWKIYCGVDRVFLEHHKDSAVMEKMREDYHLPEHYILSLSTLEPRKNLDLLLKAYNELVLKGETELPLVLAGRMGWKMENFLDSVNETVRKKIYITGFVKEEELPYLYEGAVVFIFPSKYEGFGLPPLEAMACGTPVLSSNAASMPEILEEAAIYFESGDMENLNDKIRSLGDIDTDARDQMVVRGKMQAEKYSWEKEAEKLYLLITS